jgi:precorrin-6B methylase 2
MHPLGEKVTAFMTRPITSALSFAWIALTLFLAASCSNQPAAPVQTADSSAEQPGFTDSIESVEIADPVTDVTDVTEMTDVTEEPAKPSDEPLADPDESLADPPVTEDQPDSDSDSMDDLFFGLDESSEDSEEKETKTPDVIFVPTPQEVVDRMLELAQVTKDDLVYDLGCGDGRIVATAAKKYGCKAIGFDIDPQRIKESKETVKENGVEDLVQIREEDIFKLDLSEASVVTLYLLPSLNVKLIPQLEKLKPGCRIVSHAFDMRGVKPDKVETVEGESGSEHTVYLWTTPLKKDENAAGEEDY